MDVVVGGPAAQLHLNDGQGHFQYQSDISSSMTSINCLTAGDVDADGDQDIVMTSQYQKLILLKNNGDATFVQSTFSSASNFAVCALADMDKDA